MGYPRPRVLLVDDDPLVRDSSKVLLNAHGYDVVTASDGYVGIAEIEVASFDLVVADFFMPCRITVPSMMISLTIPAPASWP